MIGLPNFWQKNTLGASKIHDFPVIFSDKRTFRSKIFYFSISETANCHRDMEIQHLLLYTNQLEKLHRFYMEKLELDPVKIGKDFLLFKIGSSLLEFRRSSMPCYYHFAINIPFNQVAQALRWCKERVEVIPYHGEEIVQFSSWNAEAIYFKDPVGNILELIARKNLDTQSRQAFCPDCFLHLSEIGLPVPSVQGAFTLLHDKAALDIYSGNLEDFCAIGDEHGLFIAIDPKTKKWIPEDDEAFYFPLEVQFKNKKGKSFQCLLEREGSFKFKD